MRINLECLRPGDTVAYKIYLDDGSMSGIISSKVRHITARGIGLRNGQFVSFDEEFKNIDAIPVATPKVIEQQERYRTEIIKRNKLTRAKRLIDAIEKKCLDKVNDADLDRILAELNTIIG